MSPLTTLTGQAAVGDAATTTAAARARQWEGRNKLAPNQSKLFQNDSISKGYSTPHGAGRESVTAPEIPRYTFCTP
jgi:hypothetical protein